MNNHTEITSLNFLNSGQWKDILKHFVDVLKINIFIVDIRGKILISSIKGRYGENFWENPLFNSKNFTESQDILPYFEKNGDYLECKHHFALHSFAIPMKLSPEKTIAYMIVGPISLHKRLDTDEFQKMSEQFSFDYNKAVNSLNEIRVLSFTNIKSILDLLQKVSKYILQLNYQEQSFLKLRFDKEIIPLKISEEAKNIYTSICFDELLVTLLDVALNITKNECGSIMLVDNEKQTLTVKISRGINVKMLKLMPVKVGVGISGIAAKDNITFLINGLDADSKIKKFLKRSEIKHSLVMPLCRKENVFGILNLHTKNSLNKITSETLNLVRNLSKLTSAAINSLHQQLL